MPKKILFGFVWYWYEIYNRTELSGDGEMREDGWRHGLGPGLRMRQYRPGSSSSPVSPVQWPGHHHHHPQCHGALVATRCRMSGHWGLKDIKRWRRFYEQIYILQNRLNMSYSGEIWQHFIICPSSWWEILYTIQSGKIEMIWTWGQKETMTHLIRKYRHQIFVCLTTNDDKEQRRSRWQVLN